MYGHTNLTAISYASCTLNTYLTKQNKAPHKVGRSWRHMLIIEAVHSTAFYHTGVNKASGPLGHKP